MPRDNLSPLTTKPQPPHTQAADWVMTAVFQLERAWKVEGICSLATAAIGQEIERLRALEAALRQRGQPVQS